MRREVIPIIIPVFNTSPETIYLVVTYLYCTTRNPVVIVNDGSNRDETIQVLRYIRELGRAIVIDKENGGKIDALLFGVEYVLRHFSPRCVFVMDDDAIPYSMTSSNIDDILYEKCNMLSDLTPVAVFPVANQIYIREEILKKIKSVESESPLYPSFAIHYLKPSLLDYVQNLEHIASTNHARLIASDGLWINGTGALWLALELRELLRVHSKEHAADDLELSVLLLKRGKSIAFFNELTLYAELITKPWKFVKQRVYWSYGAIRVLIKYPGLLLPRRGSNPLYTMYILNPYVFLALVILPLPIELKEALGVVYGVLISTQIMMTPRKKLGKIVILTGGVIVSTIALTTALAIRLLMGSQEMAHYILVFGAVFSLIYTLSLFFKANHLRNNHLRLRAPEFLILATYVFLCSITIMPAGLLFYIYRRIRTARTVTYKIA